MYYHVLEARYLGGHAFWLRFRDGTAGEVDLADELHGEVFEPLREVARFERFYVDPEGFTLAWSNGADFAPEYLHELVRARQMSPTAGTSVEPTSRAMRSSGSARAVWVTDRRPTHGTMWPVPEVCRFLGIVVFLYRRDHGTPHLHARYGAYTISMDIETLEVRGKFPPRALRDVREWTTRHRAELLENWRRVREGKRVRPLPPLE